MKGQTIHFNKSLDSSSVVHNYLKEMGISVEPYFMHKSILLPIDDSITVHCFDKHCKIIMDKNTFTIKRSDYSSDVDYHSGILYELVAVFKKLENDYKHQRKKVKS